MLLLMAKLACIWLHDRVNQLAAGLNLLCVSTTVRYFDFIYLNVGGHINNLRCTHRFWSCILVTFLTSWASTCWCYGLNASVDPDAASDPALRRSKCGPSSRARTCASCQAVGLISLTTSSFDIDGCGVD